MMRRLGALFAALLLCGPLGASARLSFVSGAYLTFYDFRNTALDARFSGSGAAGGTTTTKAGAVVAATAPRLTYVVSPPFAPQGLLAEPAATNSLTEGNSVGTSPWAAAGTTSAAPTVTVGGISAPDGTTNASTVAMPAVGTSGFSFVYQSATAAAGSAAFSIYLRGSVGGEVIYIMGTPGGNTYYSQKAVLTTSWQRFSTVAPTTAATWYWQIGGDRRDPSQTALSAATFYAWGGQEEVGAGATSLIPTTTATVSRTADAIVVTPPAGVGHLYCAFSDGTSQTNTVTAGSAFTLPTVAGKSYLYCGGLQ